MPENIPTTTVFSRHVCKASNLVVNANDSSWQIARGLPGTMTRALSATMPRTLAASVELGPVAKLLAIHRHKQHHAPLHCIPAHSARSSRSKDTPSPGQTAWSSELSMYRMPWTHASV
eukprot:5392718-Amphidinium_carterae.2